MGQQAMKEVQHFLGEGGRNAWIKALGYSVYIKRAHHHINGVTENTFDIANIQAKNMLTRPGRFWELVQRSGDLAKNISGLEYIYIECVHNQRLARSLRSRGWHELETEPPSFYLKISELNVWHGA